MIKYTPYEDANRYISNAKDTLTKHALKKDGIYGDVKYVKTAAGTAYSGVLLALDEYLKRKEGLKYTKPKSIEEYQTRIAKQNKKLRALLSEVYGDLHIALYYHGNDSVKLMENGLSTAKEIIEYIK
jgi:Domain of unknown function (DUF5618)